MNFYCFSGILGIQDTAFLSCPATDEDDSLPRDILTHSKMSPDHAPSAYAFPDERFVLDKIGACTPSIVPPRTHSLEDLP